MSTSTSVPATPPHHRQQSVTSLSSPSPSSPSSTSKNYHPYLIHTTASSVLTSSNASPTPPPVSYLKHRPSRSMSSLAEQAGSLPPSPGPGGIDVAQEREREANRRRSMESPGPGSGSGIRRGIRNGPLPSFLEDRDRGSPMAKPVVLPSDPKSWTPGELATYLGQTLRTGGPDGAGKILPGPLVEDIKTWVLRQQVTGRVFLRGNADSWSTSGRAPPFLPLLLTLSRKLRRSSVQRPSLGGAHELPLETDEEDKSENEEEEVSGVRRMANMIEMRDSASSASEMSEDEGGRIRHLSSGSEGWDRWGLKPQHTGSSVGSASSDSPVSRSTSMEHIGMRRSLLASTEPSPPPPYSPLFDPVPSPAHRAISQSNSNEGTPKADKRFIAVTPNGQSTPSRTRLSNSNMGDPLCLSPAGSMATSTDATPSKYGPLRGKGHVRRVRAHNQQGDGYDSSDEAPVSAMRKVTIRPSIRDTGGVFDSDIEVGGGGGGIVVKTEREMELEKQLADVLNRIKKLEEERGPGPRPGSLGAWMGKSGEGVLPDRVSDLPAYLILVGVGVGAMMLRVMLSRRS